MRPEKLDVLARLTNDLSHASSAEEVYAASLDCLQESLGVERASILLFDDHDVMSFVAWRGISDHYRAAVRGHTPWRPESRNIEPVLVPDAELDPSLANYLDLFRAEGIRALGFFALTHRDRVIGKFMLYYAAPHQFTGEEIALAKTIAGQIAFGVTRITTERALKLAEERHGFLSEASGVLSATLDYEKSLAQVAERIVAVLGDWCVIDIIEEESVNRVAVRHRDPAMSATAERLRAEFPPGKMEIGLGRRVIESNAPLLLHEIDEQTAERLKGSPVAAIFNELGCASLMIVPVTAAGRASGAISIVSSDPARRFDENDLAVAVELGRRAGYAIDHSRLYRQAQAANRAKDEFLATLSHELRTPMTATLGWASMLRMTSPSADTFQLAVETIERSMRAQAKLIEDIFDVSRIVTGKLRLQIAPVDLPRVIQGAVETIQPSISAKGLRLELSIDSVSEVLLGDGARLQQVVWNLLSNAVKFTPSGGSIRIDVRGSSDALQISVRDSGQGIPMRVLPFIFERFRQGDGSATRVHGGLGLGLAIVKSIVELHGGSVVAESDGDGQGATFTVTLPLVRPHPHDSAPATDARAKAVSLSGVDVLVVEDDDDTRFMMSKALEMYGAQVVAVGSAPAAIEALRRKRPHIVLSDIAMPGEDGYSLMMKIRSGVVESCRDVPAIAVTAFARPQDRDRILAAGFREHLSKPVDAQVMLQAVKTLVEA